MTDDFWMTCFADRPPLLVGRVSFLHPSFVFRVNDHGTDRERHGNDARTQLPTCATTRMK
jgi:hypothetical protein